MPTDGSAGDGPAGGERSCAEPGRSRVPRRAAVRSGSLALLSHTCASIQCASLIKLALDAVLIDFLAHKADSMADVGLESGSKCVSMLVCR